MEFQFLKFKIRQEPSRSNNFATRSVGCSNEVKFVIGKIRQEFHRTLDLNCPSTESSTTSPQFPFKQSFINVDNENEARSRTKETKKRRFPNGKNPIPDLNLQPSSQGESSKARVSSVASSQCSKMPLKTKGIEGLPKSPTLVVMGCRHCLIYVMVSDMDPDCPKCNASNLIDSFRKRPRYC